MPNHATLTIDLSAVAANYRLLKARHATHAVGAVVKADAYGLGLGVVSKRLWKEGCREFFVATLEEGTELRRVLPEANITVFQGMLAREEKEYRTHRLFATVNTLEQFKRQAAGPERLTLQVDTGMTRLGLTQKDLSVIAAMHQVSASGLVMMSHLACASDPAHGKNAEQLQRFGEALKLFPGARASLCNSAGIFLSPDYHFDLGRPGCALYGIHPAERPGENPMRPVATLSAPILQIRELEREEAVGYGATFKAAKNSRIAIVGLGYADGYLRSLGGKGVVFVGGRKAPVVGRVSMDMVAVDMTGFPEMKPGARAEFINARYTVNDMAHDAGTIGYEIFARLGRRVKRVYV